jgi:tetratricopeptide (TPR) repeat protein
MPNRKFPLWLALCVLFVFAQIAAANVGPEESLPELIRRVKPAVVSVITYNAAGEVALTGSGFFIRPGEVITNLHVVEGARRVEIRTFEGKGKTYPVAGLRAIDEDGDLAVLQVQMPSDRAPVSQISQVIPEEGERIFVIGNPLRLEGSVSDGIVSAVREVPSLGRIIQITAPISHGNSGSPVFNMRGQVIGVVTIRVMNGQNINLALGAARVTDLKSDASLVSFAELAARARSYQKSDALSDWWYRNGLNSLWLGNYETALGYFETAVNKNPNRVEAWIQVGFCRVKQGRNQEAVKAFEQALRLEPDSYEALTKLGDAHYFGGSYHKALEAYKRALALRPDLAESHYNLAVTFLEVGDEASAQAHARALERLDSSLYAKIKRELSK